MLLFALRRLAYKTLFGGVEGFWSDHYRLINGFPNRFWGWGGEDDDLYVRYVARQAFLQAVCQVWDKKRLLTGCLSGLRQEYSQLTTGYGRVLYNWSMEASDKEHKQCS